MVKKHPYNKRKLLMDDGYWDNINPVLRLLREKIQMQFVFLTVSCISEALKSAASSGLLSFCPGRNILDSCKSFVSYLSQNPSANSRSLIRTAILMKCIKPQYKPVTPSVFITRPHDQHSIEYDVYKNYRWVQFLKTCILKRKK